MTILEIEQPEAPVEIRHTPHFDDIDYNRHVNGSVYEKYAANARFVWLSRAGLAPERMMDENIRLRPVAASMKFLKQQSAGRELAVRTRAIRKDDAIFWEQSVFGPEAEEACRMTMETVLERGGERIAFPDALGEASEAEPAHDPIPAFNQSCQRVATPLRARYADTNLFQEVAPAVLWKYVEEGRNEFGIALDMTLETMIREGTILFTLDGAYRYGRPVRGGENLTVHTWLGGVSKMRCNMRHTITAENGDIVYQGTETLLAVSPTKSRPVRVPDWMMQLTEDYLER